MAIQLHTYFNDQDSAKLQRLARLFNVTYEELVHDIVMQKVNEELNAIDKDWDDYIINRAQEAEYND